MLKYDFLRSSWQNYALALLLGILTLLLGGVLNRDIFLPLIGIYALFFGLYLYLALRKQQPTTIYFFVAVAILLRFLLVFSFPNLSDDVYRFIWDGRLLVQGVNPFDQLPVYYMEEETGLVGIDRALFERLNSPTYFTIYPPIAQFNFWIANAIFPTHLYGATVLMKLQLFGFEVGAIYLLIQLLRHFELPVQRVLLYALNPLIIVEIMGNLHFEGAMVCLLLLSVWYMLKQQRTLSAIAFAGSVAAKLLPLMFLPFLLKRLGWRRTIQYGSIVAAVLLLLFAPLWSGAFFGNFGTSLNLYFQKFEFNASVYYLLRWVGYQYKGYNIIQQLGPSLAVGTFVGILLMTLLERQHIRNQKGHFYKISPLSEVNWRSWLECMLFAITLYLSFTTIVHPWYTALPLVCCLFTSYRYPVLWTACIMLTYINYSYEPYRENLVMVAIEYVLVFGYAAYEWQRERGFLSKKNAI